MIYSDTSLRQGLLQECEDICGLGATGITSNTTLLQQFTRWSNKWAKIGASIAIKAQSGWDFDDPAWTTYPSGTYPGTTDRDYVFASTEKLLKIKKVGISYDGTNYITATPIDTYLDQEYTTVRKDPNVDQLFDKGNPRYDPRTNSIDIYPKFTQAEVDAGAKVYVEFYREPKEFATSGTDTQEPGFASPYHQLISKGASYEYCSLYRPDLAQSLRLDLYGNGGNIKGIIKEMQEWYNKRYLKQDIITPETVHSI